MPVITDIVQQQKNKNYYSIFIDQQYSFSLSIADLNYLQLKINSKITREKLDYYLNTYALQQAKDHAYRLLSRKSYSQQEMLEKLITKYNEKICHKVIRDLKALNYLNDKELIYAYAQNKIELKPRGRLKLQQELRQKKFPEDLIIQTLEKIYQQYDEYELALQLFHKRFKSVKDHSDIKTLNKIKNFLLSNGFTFNIINRIISNKQS